MATVTMREPRNPKTPKPAPFAPGQPAPDGTITVTDTRGRKLVIKSMSLLEEMDLLAAAGVEQAANSRWMQYATIVCCVRQIDGDHLSPPLTGRVLRSNIQQVGTEGFRAALNALAADLPEGVADLDPAAAKN